jgi:hypothetical protein
MPNPIPTDEIDDGLGRAAALGVISAYSMRRAPGPLKVRWWRLTFADDEEVEWTVAQVDAFSTGVRETARALGVEA